MSYVVHVKTPTQAILYNAVMRGQISDGHWENAKPSGHWQVPSSARALVSTGKLGTNFTPRRSYNFNAGQLWSAIGDVMIFYAKVAHVFPKVADDPEKDLHALDYVRRLMVTGEETSVGKLLPLEQVEKELEKSHDYVKRSVETIKKLLDAKDLKELHKAYEMILNYPIGQREVKKELSQLTAIFNGTGIHESLLSELVQRLELRD